MSVVVASEPLRVLSKVMVPTRDGVELCTDVYLAHPERAQPTILVRTPYGRQVPFLLMLARRLNAAGFAVALQDSRGRYQSTGTFSSWKFEHSDGHDTLGWIGRQAWANGSVGLVGISITGASNFLLAATPPPPGISIRALVSIVAILDYYSLYYRRGVLVQHWAEPVSLMMLRNRLGGPPPRWSEIFDYLPLVDVLGHGDCDTGPWRWVLEHQMRSDEWDQFGASSALGDIGVPILHLSGWYDFLLHQTLEAFDGLAPSRERKNAPQRLVIGPWDHKTIFSAFSGRSAPTSAREPSANLMQYAIEWLTRWCVQESGDAGSDAVLPPANEPAVQLFLMKEDVWIGAQTFPPPEAEQQTWYLSSGGAAQTAAGDGRLALGPAPASGHDTFVYDPANPVPTVGGAVWFFPPAKLAAGPFDQSAVETRSDVLVYTTEPLAEALVVAGPVTVSLWASTSARDTDFTAKLVDVGADGVPRIIQDGIVRARFARSDRVEELVAPDRPVCYDIDLQATAYRFQAGHRLRLEVSSSNFPKFNRHLNVTEPFYKATSGVPARQTVFHGGAMPSCLRLTVLPREAVEANRLHAARSAEESSHDAS